MISEIIFVLSYCFSANSDSKGQGFYFVLPISPRGHVVIFIVIVSILIHKSFKDVKKLIVSICTSMCVIQENPIINSLISLFSLFSLSEVPR